MNEKSVRSSPSISEVQDKCNKMDVPLARFASVDYDAEHLFSWYVFYLVCK